MEGRKGCVKLKKKERWENKKRKERCRRRKREKMWREEKSIAKRKNKGGKMGKEKGKMV